MLTHIDVVITIIIINNHIIMNNINPATEEFRLKQHVGMFGPC